MMTKRIRRLLAYCVFSFLRLAALLKAADSLLCACAEKSSGILQRIWKRPTSSVLGNFRGKSLPTSAKIQMRRCRRILLFLQFFLMSGKFKCNDVVTFDLFALYFGSRLNSPFSGLFAFRRPKLRFAHFPSVRRTPDRLKNGFVVGFRLQTEKESAKVATSQLFPISNGCLMRLWSGAAFKFLAAQSFRRRKLSASG